MTLLKVKRPRTSPSGSSLPRAVGRTLACPKSASLIWQSLLTSTLLGLRSRWMMRLSCKNSTAGCGVGGCTRVTKEGDNWTPWLQRNPHHLHRLHPACTILQQARICSWSYAVNEIATNIVLLILLYDVKYLAVGLLYVRGPFFFFHRH